MHFCSIISLLALFQASASAITWSPTCNADNCLRGLFGTNVKTTAANIAACSTGLPTVTVLVDGTVSTTMTATVAPPAVASVCDGQGIDKRAARFKSACSCIGIKPTTVTQSLTTTAVETAFAGEATFGSLANGNNYAYCNFGYEIFQIERTSSGPSYTIPLAGQIVSATTFDGSPGTLTFEIWRPGSSGSETESAQYSLVGKSEPLELTGSGTILSFTLPQPIQVEPLDRLGLYAQGGSCLAFSGDQGDAHAFNFAPEGTTSVGELKSFSPTPQYLVNVEAVLRY